MTSANPFAAPEHEQPAEQSETVLRRGPHLLVPTGLRAIHLPGRCVVTGVESGLRDRRAKIRWARPLALWQRRMTIFYSRGPDAGRRERRLLLHLLINLACAILSLGGYIVFLQYKWAFLILIAGALGLFMAIRTLVALFNPLQVVRVEKDHLVIAGCSPAFLDTLPDAVGNDLG